MLKGKSVLLCLHTEWVRPRPWCHALSQRRTDAGDKQKQKTVSLVFHESNAFIETISGCQTAQGQALKNGKKKKKYFMVLKGS